MQHVGRMLVFASRSVDPATGKRKRPSWVPLKDKTVKAGAPPPPDHDDEVSDPLDKKLKSCVHHVDGAQANKKAHKRDEPLQGQPLLDVNHSKKQFSRFAKVPLKEVGAKLAAHLAKRKSSSKKSARFRVSTNRAEALAGQNKVMMRRMAGGKLPSRAHKAASWLAASHLRRSPGYEALSTSFGEFFKTFLDKGDPTTVLDRAQGWLKAKTSRIAVPSPTAKQERLTRGFKPSSSSSSSSSR